jgi:deoxyadenosine/deoxycytidine kinase
MTIIAIEGNIGSGKTTLINILKNKLISEGKKVKVLDEPINEHLLNLYLSDRKRYGLMFQFVMLGLRLDCHKRSLKYSDKGYIVLLDRSLYGDKVFCKLHLEYGKHI